MSGDEITVTLRREQWLVLVEAASSYDRRVPLEQGDGGECLDVIREALRAPRAHTATVAAIGERMDVLAFTTERSASWESIYKALRRELGEILDGRREL